MTTERLNKDEDAIDLVTDHADALGLDYEEAVFDMLAKIMRACEARPEMFGSFDSRLKAARDAYPHLYPKTDSEK